MNIENIHQLFLKSQGIQTDSRKIEKNQIYWALKGERFDGNLFAEDALQKGAAYAIIDDEKYKTDERIVVVDDTLLALQQLANYHRRQFDIPVIGITGSNGKTTTKELILAVLQKKYNTLATLGNLNNHFGVPQTLLRLTDQYEIAIIEMGANHLGEIADLCKIAEPNYGLITSIGRAHIGEFGGYENIKTAKSELYEWLQNNDGTAFINQDVQMLIEMADNRTVDKRISYGSNPNSQFTYAFLSSHPYVRFIFDGSEVQSQIPGQHNYSNLITAVTVGQYFGVPKEKIIEAIQEYRPDNNRSQVLQYKAGTLILDAYNANPSSTEVALKMLGEINASKKGAILGSMLELGEYSRDEHQKITQIAETLALDFLVLVGKEFAETQTLSSTMKVGKVEDIKDWFQSLDISDTTVLIKGSRGVHLEDILS